MKSLLALVAVVGMGTDLYARLRDLAREGAASVSLKDLPDFNGASDYKVDPYIATAVKLQAAGKEKAGQLLMNLAEDPDHRDRQKVIVLCRMLFTAKPKGEFRRPGIGGAIFLGDTDYADWPLEPIELVDGLPFLITRGYRLGGKAEHAKSYVRYCLENCAWPEERFKAKGDREKRKALEKLLASPKWKAPLSDDEKQFLASQIK